MLRIFIVIGNKVAINNKNEVMLPFDQKDGIPFDEGIYRQYGVKVCRKSYCAQWDFWLIDGVAEKKRFNQSMVTFAQAIKCIDVKEIGLIEFIKKQKSFCVIQLQYGLRDGRILHISEIAQNERGVGCNCKCPSCGAALQARMGAKRHWHFAHNNTGCDLISAQQTALHMLAKELIEQEGKIRLPGVSVNRKDTSFANGHDFENVLPEKFIYQRSSVIQCQSVALEKRISGIVPDIVLQVKGKVCLVEIAVTHFVDEAKQKKIKEIGLPVMEIDLSALYGDVPDRENVKRAVLQQEDNRYWIYNPLYEKAKEKAEQHWQRIINEKKAEQAERIRRERETKKKEYLQKEERQKKIRQMFQSKNYKARLLELKNDKKAAQIVKQCRFYHECGDQFPFYVNIPVTGEMIFACDRRIWQCLLFDKFVYYRKSDGTVGVEKILQWIKLYQNEIPVDWQIACKTIIETPTGSRKQLLLLEDVVRCYLKYIAYLGFIKNQSLDYFRLQAPHTLMPPNPIQAARLQNALAQIDWFDPFVDDAMDFLLWKENVQKNGKVRSVEEYRQEEFKRLEKIKERGKLQVVDQDYEKKEEIKDVFGYRWFRCIECLNICREDEMVYYGGENGRNKGLCKLCLRKGNR